MTSLFETLQAYLGSEYINDFNRFGRTFRVYAQADAQFRAHPEDVANLKTRNASGEMVPLGSVANVRFATGPDRVAHYNVYLASDIHGAPAPRLSPGPEATAM